MTNPRQITDPRYHRHDCTDLACEVCFPDKHDGKFYCTECGSPDLDLYYALIGHKLICRGCCEKRLSALEAEGLTRSDAQGALDAELRFGKKFGTDSHNKPIA